MQLSKEEKTMSKLLKAIGLISLMIMFSSVTAIAAKPVPVVDIPITNNLADYDANSAQYLIQSDGLGAYHSDANGDISVLIANGWNGLDNGDWRLFLATPRTAAITFSAANAVQPGDPGYLAPANPPWWGTQNNSMRAQANCTYDNHDMLTMHAGDKFTCPVLIRLGYIGSATDYYQLHMGWQAPGTEEVQVSCNFADSGGCNDWYIDPIPVIHGDGSVSPGKTRARLLHYGQGKKIGTTNEGDFYLTYHIHATRP